MALLSSFAGLRLGEHAASTAELRVRSPCARTPRAACSVYAAAGGASSAERRERRHKIIRKKVRACAALRSAVGGGKSGGDALLLWSSLIFAAGSAGCDFCLDRSFSVRAEDARALPATVALASACMSEAKTLLL
jgi:hypothetical protein